VIKLTQRQNLFLKIILIIILGFSVYSNCLKGKFVWDDYGLVKDNVYIKDWKYLPKIIKEDFGAGGGTKSNFYRPLQMIVHAADYSLWGLKVEGYHFTSILLHILAAIALYFFINALFDNTGISFLVSLLFVAHPINTEAVCYISGVGDPLSLLFMLLCLIFYIKSASAKNIVLYILALLSFVIALFSKENAVILPVLVLVYQFTFRKSLEAKRIIPFFAILITYLSLRLTILSPFSGQLISPVALLQRIPGFFAALAEYLRLLLLPFGLHIEYGNKLFNMGDPRAIMGMLIALLLIVFAFLKRKKNNLVFFSITWFFLTLFPVSNIYPINDAFMMEHWIYVPSLGFFLILSAALCRPFKNKYIMFFLKGFAIALLVCYSYLTIKQAEYWKEPISFYKKSLQYTPESWRFYNALGIEYEIAGRNNEALASYSKALKINPGLAGVYLNLGNLYHKIGRDKEAVSMYGKAQEINSKVVQEYFENGKKYMDAGKYRKAVGFFKDALELEPNNSALHNELANVYIIIGKYKEAIKSLNAVIRLYPNLGTGYNNMALAYYYDRQYDLAARYCDKAIELGYTVSPKLLGLIKPHRK
jgi:protein O-mannosyl-transferase